MIKLTRDHTWGIASACAATFALFFCGGTLVFLQLLSKDSQFAAYLLLFIPFSAVISLLFSCGIGEIFLEWWCSKPKTIHRHMIVASAAFISCAVLGLLTVTPQPKHD